MTKILILNSLKKKTYACKAAATENRRDTIQTNHFSTLLGSRVALSRLFSLTIFRFRLQEDGLILIKVNFIIEF